MRISGVYNSPSSKIYNNLCDKNFSQRTKYANEFKKTNIQKIAFKAQNVTNSKHFSLNRINPVNIYLNKLLDRSLCISRRRDCSLIPELKNITKEVNIGKTYGWDINPNNSKKYLVFLHGASQNITLNQELYKSIIDKTNYAVLAPEYRSFGKTKEKIFTISNLKEDTNSVYTYLTKDKNIKPKNIIVVGHSFGGYVAAQMTKSHQNISKLILVAPIDSFENGSINFERGLKNKIPKWVTFLFKNFAFLRKKTYNSVCASLLRTVRYNISQNRQMLPKASNPT